MRFGAWLVFIGCLFVSVVGEVMAATSDAQPPIIVAVVDDGFISRQPQFKGMLWRNAGEVANNGRDDDGNGAIDDLNGWDVSDQDENLNPPANRLDEFAHGTHIAGIIAGEIRRSLGEMADYPIKLMLVKAISDSAIELNMKDGYLGLDYALDNQADIVNLSWSGGQADAATSQLLARARHRQTFIVGSVGTFRQADPSFPSSHPAVFGVGGIDAKGHHYSSNIGDEVDLVASAVSPALAGSEPDPAKDGVSNAVALVTATVALMKLRNRSASNLEIKHCLQSTAQALDKLNPTFAGQLGAGALNQEQAIACIDSLASRARTAQSVELLEQAKGQLYFQHRRRSAKNDNKQWLLRPQGEYLGLAMHPFVEGDPGDSELHIYSGRQTDDKRALIWRGRLDKLPVEIDSEYANWDVQLITSSKRAFKFAARYATRNINFAERFCKGTKTFTAADMTEPLFIEDGSGDEPYAAESDCKWLFIPAPGHDLKIEFLQIDSELNVDTVQLFRGDGTLQTNFLVKVSGDKVPAPMLLQRDPLLLWFLSDGQNQGKGFSVKVTMVPTTMQPQRQQIKGK